MAWASGGVLKSLSVCRRCGWGKRGRSAIRERGSGVGRSPTPMNFNHP